MSHTSVWQRHKKDVSNIINISENISQINGHHYGNQCYVVHHKALSKLLDSNHTIIYPADILLTNLGLKVYMSNKSLVHQKYGLGSYTQNNKKYSIR